MNDTYGMTGMTSYASHMRHRTFETPGVCRGGAFGKQSRRSSRGWSSCLLLRFASLGEEDVLVVVLSATVEE